jgi:hypothetical protein
MMRRAKPLAGVACGLSLATAALAAPPTVESLLNHKASTLDVGLLGLATGLSQTAFGEYDSLKTRRMETRFIPQQVYAYYLPEPSGQNIHIVANYANADKSLSKQDVQDICNGMLRWVRFHLGIKDNGKPIAHATRYGSSALFQYMRPGEVDPELYEKELAFELDKQTILIGDVSFVGGAGPTAFCKMSLTEP